MKVWIHTMRSGETSLCLIKISPFQDHISHHPRGIDKLRTQISYTCILVYTYLVYCYVYIPGILVCIHTWYAGIYIPTPGILVPVYLPDQNLETPHNTSNPLLSQYPILCIKYPLPPQSPSKCFSHGISSPTSLREQGPCALLHLVSGIQWS